MLRDFDLRNHLQLVIVGYCKICELLFKTCITSTILLQMVSRVGDSCVAQVGCKSLAVWMMMMMMIMIILW